MKFIKLAAAATALSLVAAPAAVSAQDATTNAQVTAGATVYGPQGGVVGTIETIANGVVTVDTGKHKAPLPANAFGKGENGPTITVTKAQIDAMLDQQVAAAAAQRDAVLVAGAMVHSADDAMLGTVESVEGDAVVVKLSAGPVELKREHFAVNQQGTLIALFTEAQLAAATSGAATAATPASTAASVGAAGDAESAASE